MNPPEAVIFEAQVRRNKGGIHLVEHEIEMKKEVIP